MFLVLTDLFARQGLRCLVDRGGWTEGWPGFYQFLAFEIAVQWTSVS